MARKLEYRCPMDVDLMSTNKYGYYCESCHKNIIDLTSKSYKEIDQILNTTENKTCIHIQESRLSIITSNRSKWQLFIVLALNIKSFFLEKIYSQSLLNTSIDTKQKTIDRIIIGQIFDSITKKPVRTPYIEVYRNESLINLAKGDYEGKFEFIINNSPASSDTISLRITSHSHIGKVIERMPINKIKTVIKTTIPKEGIEPEFNNRNINSWKRHDEPTWTGRVDE